MSHTGSVSSACLNRDRRKVLVGTRGSEIFEFATNDESDLNKGALVSGHCAGSLKAVACHPILPEVATVGDDGYLRTWSLSSHKQLRKLNVGYASRALRCRPRTKTPCTPTQSPPCSARGAAPVRACGGCSGWSPGRCGCGGLQAPWPWIPYRPEGMCCDCHMQDRELWETTAGYHCWSEDDATLLYPNDGPHNGYDS